MKYDFTSIIERKGKDAVAVDALPQGMYQAAGREFRVREGFDMIPMWIADMNFKTVPTVTEEIAKRIEHPLFGYFDTKDEYYDAIIAWQKRQNGVEGLRKEHIGYENGVLGGVSAALHILCSQGDSVLVNSPTYVGFTRVLQNCGYHIVHSDLKLDEEKTWRLDFEDMERKIVENHVHCAIFCSPHNPTGRVWERWELEKVMELFKKHEVYVISDEIWSDIILYGNRHIPTQSVSEDARERTIAFYAPSKTFNLAGLIGSYHIVYNGLLRDRLLKESSLSHYNSMNVLSMYASIGAWKPEGYEWVSELREVLGENARYACDFIEAHFEGVSVSRPQGTYMLFINCEEWCKKHGKTLEELLCAGYEVGVFWQSGKGFNGPWSIRMNLALPKARLEEAMNRLREYVF